MKEAERCCLARTFWGFMRQKEKMAILCVSHADASRL